VIYECPGCDYRCTKTFVCEACGQEKLCFTHHCAGTEAICDICMDYYQTGGGRFTQWNDHSDHKRWTGVVLVYD